jgi:ParB family chromosome partitioning protein
VEQGVYPGLKAALNHLYQNVSRAKRSKIGSFVTVYRALDGVLKFPAAIPERLGLALAQRLESDPALSDQLKGGLAEARPATAAEEQALLARLLHLPRSAGPRADRPEKPAGSVEPAPGIWLQVATGPLGARYLVSGPGLDAAFGKRLADWLSGQG